jgi:malate dehydrogenase (oxaloacetate-decarboxylating)
LPVMEGKALLFKYLGGVDAAPLCVRTRSAEELIALVQALEPSFGGVNLEDIAQPKCFRVLDELRATLSIPVWHDDQQGTATAVLAALENGLKVVGKRLSDVCIALVGMGAANVANYRLLVASGADPQRIVACDRGGTLHANREDLSSRQAEFPDKWRVCVESNARNIRGGIEQALAGADVCLAFSSPGPGVIRPDWVHSMAGDAIVFACANPIPEIWPAEARAGGAKIVATGRGDFPNQVNNSLVFPAVFRGTLDARASSITQGMAMAAARELSAAAEEGGLSEDRIVPAMDDWQMYARVAAATAMQAQAEGVSTARRSWQEWFALARRRIERTRDAVRVLDRAGCLEPDTRAIASA